MIGAGELSNDCHKSLNIKEGVSYFPFDHTMCKGDVRCPPVNLHRVSNNILEANLLKSRHRWFIDKFMF